MMVTCNALWSETRLELNENVKTRHRSVQVQCYGADAYNRLHKIDSITI